jgi:hypothetical protein
MTDLATIQHFVVDAITREAPLATDEALARACDGVTTGNARLSPSDQLDIYREQFWLRHTGALEEDFTAVARLIGKDAFFELCAKYMKTCPPASFTLRDLGDRFADFVAETKPYADDALLCDIARVEWAFVEAFDAPDAPPLDPHKIAATPEDAWPGAVVAIHPALRLLALRHPAQELRIRARQTESGGAGEGASASTNEGACTDECEHAESLLPRIEPADTYLVVFRAPDVLKYIDVEREAYVLLGKLAAKVPLGRACEETIAETGADAAAFEQNVGAWFQSWTQWGWVTDLIVT